MTQLSFNKIVLFDNGVDIERETQWAKKAQALYEESKKRCLDSICKPGLECPLMRELHPSCKDVSAEILSAVLSMESFKPYAPVLGLRITFHRNGRITVE